MRQVEEAVSRILAYRKQTQILFVVHTLLYGVALLLGWLGLYIPCVILGVGNILAYLFYLRGRGKQYSALVSRAKIRFGLCAPLDNVVLLEREGLSLEDYKALEILPVREDKGGILTWQGFCGEKNGMTLRGWEISTHYPIAAGGKVDYKYLAGTLLTAEGKFFGQGDWLLLRQNLLDAAAQAKFLTDHGYREAKSPIKGLTKEFQLYTKSGMTELPHPLAERLNRLMEKVDDMGAVRLAGDRAGVYLVNRFYTRRTRMEEQPTAEMVSYNPLQARDPVWALFQFWQQNT